MAAVPTFLLPDGFDCASIVGPLKADAARWLVSTILRKVVAHDVDARGFAILSSAILERVMGHGYAKIVRAMMEAEVVQRSPYRDGRSFGYRLAEDYLAGHPRWAPITNPVLLNRIRQEQQRFIAEQADRCLPIHSALDAAQQGLTIQPEARAVVELLPRKSRLCQQVHVDRIERHVFPLTISSTGRVFNGLSGLKKDLRSLIRLDGEPIGCVDISNSQPAILGNLLVRGFPCQRGKRCSNIKHHRGAPLAPPLSSSCPPSSSFLALASSGTLYEDLAEACGMDRESAKKRFLVDVLAKKGRYPSDVENAFRGRFPEVWGAIQEINHRSHCELIRVLQRLEAWLVVETVSPCLVERIPIVTLHDAIFGRVRDLGTIDDAFQDALALIGWKLSLKREISQP